MAMWRVSPGSLLLVAVLLLRQAAAAPLAATRVGDEDIGSYRRLETGRKRKGVQGAHLPVNRPLGLFFRTSIPFLWRILSAFPPA
jgi:hypothetical protein